MHTKFNLTLSPSLFLPHSLSLTLTLSPRLLTCTTEPIFNFVNPNITIPEPDGPAQICITMTGRNVVPITVTAMTGPKSGTSDEATGNVMDILQLDMGRGELLLCSYCVCCRIGTGLLDLQFGLTSTNAIIN